MGPITVVGDGLAFDGGAVVFDARAWGTRAAGLTDGWVTAQRKAGRAVDDLRAPAARGAVVALPALVAGRAA